MRTTELPGALRELRDLKALVDGVLPERHRVRRAIDGALEAMSPAAIEACMRVVDGFLNTVSAERDRLMAALRAAEDHKLGILH